MRTGIYAAISAERDRQDDLVRRGEIPSNGAAKDAPAELIMTALAEEVGEVARAILEDDHEGLRTELIQVAAVAVAMVEGLDALTLRLPDA